MNKFVCICAGGTGGHINAALSLGEYFQARDLEPFFYTGTRYLDYQLFKHVSDRTLHLEAKPLRGKNLLITLKNALVNAFVLMTVIFKFLSRRPAAVIGAGGYVCGPALLAAKTLGIKTYIIEQNAVAGLTNKLLSKISDKIFVNFKNTRGIGRDDKVIVSGNPIRSNISYRPIEPKEPYRVLIFGGSLGAKQINEVIEKLVGREWDTRLSVVHQVGKGNLKDFPVSPQVNYTQEEYLDNMDEMYRWAHIVISRSGASTVSELREAKRPCILIPFPFATDNHQELNAQELKNENMFYVKIANQGLDSIEMEAEIRSSVREIIGKNLFYPFKECATLNSCKIIYEEVMGDVRNK
ncbi:MAG: UDP-N-acetylglucosamine--N-acetylmuramyl-(pentapeptide) pyrophosphoryl-undecaprenol N-acetylglucosamine transferase [Bacteriovoracaceae bacterium]